MSNIAEAIKNMKAKNLSTPEGMRIFVSSLVKQSVSEEMKKMEEEIANEIEKTIYDVVDQRITEKFKGDKGEMPTQNEIIDIIKPLIPPPVKGDAYTLTNKDKQEIAKSIDVPIVEKIIEKTEIIKQQPIVTQITKEVAVADTPDQVVSKIIKSDKLIPQSKIEGLLEEFTAIKKRLVSSVKGSQGGGMGLLVHQSFATSSATTTITLSNNIAAGGFAIFGFYNGQFLVRGTHYTTSGKIITFTFTLNDATNVDFVYWRT